MTDIKQNNHPTRGRKPSVTYLDFHAQQSDICSCDCETTKQSQQETMQMNRVQLLSAKEAGQVLGVNPNVVYMLWKKNLLDFWCIHGTKKTNLDAIAQFLEKTRNQELQLDSQ